MDNFTVISKKTPKKLRPEDKNEYQIITSLKKTPFVLDKIKKFTVGRSTKNSIKIPQGTTSDTHASIKWQKSSYKLKDEGSTNGTYLNDKRIEKETALKNGDKIKIGKYVFKFVVKKVRVKK